MANDGPMALQGAQQPTSDNSSSASVNVLLQLRRLPLFAELSDEQFKRVAGLLHAENRLRGALLIEQGNFNTNLYILRRGRAMTRAVDVQGVEHRGPFINPGGVFNERSFLYGTRNEETAEALDRIVVWYIRREEFRALLDSDANLEANLVYPQAERQSGAVVRRYNWQRPTETVLMYGKKHPWVFIRTLWPVLLEALILAVVAQLFFGSPPQSLPPLIIAPALVIAIGYVTYMLIDWLNDYYAVTDQRVLHRERVLLLRDEQDEVPMRRIQDIKVDRPSFMSLFLDFGDVTIEALGTRARVKFSSIRRPDDVTRAIFEQQKRTQAEYHASQRSKIRSDLRHELELAGDGGPALIGPAARPNTPSKVTQNWRQFQSSLREFRNTFMPFMRITDGAKITYRKHWLELLRTIWKPLLALAVYMAVLLVIRLSNDLALERFVFGLPTVFVVVLAGVGLGVWLLYKYEDWRNDLYMLTADRIVDIDRSPFGLRGTSRKEAWLGNVQNVLSQTRGVIDVMFNIGDVIIKTGGSEGELTFERVHNPRAVQRDIVDHVEAFEANNQEKQAAQRRQELTEWLGIYDELTRLHERRKLG